MREDANVQLGGKKVSGLNAVRGLFYKDQKS